MRSPDLRWSVRGRLWAALAALAASTLVAGSVAMIALAHAEARLEALHRETLAEVADAPELSRSAADLATSAPYLLNLPSVIRVRQEADAIGRTITEIRSTAGENDDVSGPLASMDIAVKDLVAATGRMTEVRERSLRLVAELSRVERRVALATADPGAALPVRRGWLQLQRLASAAIGAGRADSLIAAGEFQREYYLQLPTVVPDQLDPDQQEALDLVTRLVAGADGLFTTRRLELSERLAGQNALFRIRRASEALSETSADVVATAEAKLSGERNATSSSIAVARLAVIGAALTSIAIAAGAALFVSGYVTGNLAAIADAMMRLASGDRTSRLPRGEGSGDEIGKLFHAFRAFRANALRLDRSNRQLAQKNALFERVFGNISDGVAIMGEDGRLVVANPCLPRILRVPPALLSKRPTLEELRAAAPFEGSGEGDWQSRDGFIVEARRNSLPDGGAVWLFADTTEKRRVDERLAQIQRIESLGQVTGEVAHDFGNILSTIAGSLQLWKPGDTGDEALRNRIRDAVDIGVALTQRLLVFARKQHLEPEIVELNTLMDGLTDLISFAMRDDVTLKVHAADAPLHVRVDPGQLESAILNLCLNANQAIEGPGEVSIKLAEADGGRAVITVQDDGHGMEPDVMRHAMEPFYSARADGTGTGLGLSMVYGFIRQSGGDIQITSARGEGTAVSLYLPIAMADTPSLSVGLNRLCLAVDDEPAALQAIARAMTSLGCRTETASGYRQALDRMKNGETPDLLVTDLNLDAGQSGWELAETFLGTSSNGHVVVVSGHLPPDHPLLDRFGARIAMVSKPATAAILAPIVAASIKEQEIHI
ncbi:ATP-binding protein [Frigidibacter sp. RF13]|uniref:ATP-binding protein n=1 Tax=Frigidibacter sp. RF13 TaxID=2997340 RepID=UPI00226E0CBD|nr:ATP-binding protein [Frigidibacter sp. RF13]MCY1126383.1 ATP-binding protein [Frigidibacter sp. RF13]